MISEASPIPFSTEERTALGKRMPALARMFDEMLGMGIVAIIDEQPGGQNGNITQK